MSPNVILKMTSSVVCFSGLTFLFSNFVERPVVLSLSQSGIQVNSKTILSFENSGSKRTAIDEVQLAVETNLPLEGFPEERLYYFLDGCGIMSIYEEFPEGDVYELRQDVAIYMTPGIKHEILNTGETCYVLVGNGKFIWNDKEIPCKAGSCISYPPGVLRKLENTGKYPMSYICISSFLE